MGASEMSFREVRDGGRRDTRRLRATEGDIDDQFGWDQKNRKKQSQLHYHGRDDRMKRARVTMML